jgi:hypothetical protein
MIYRQINRSYEERIPRLVWAVFGEAMMVDVKVKPEKSLFARLLSRPHKQYLRDNNE